MIIPIRCVSCGKVLASKWAEYDRLVKAYEEKVGDTDADTKAKASSLHANFDDPFRGDIMDKLGIVKMCCRRHMLGHVELIDTI